MSFDITSFKVKVLDGLKLPERLLVEGEHGFEGFPCTLVEAPICRPDLLCETEALAVLPRYEGSS